MGKIACARTHTHTHPPTQTICQFINHFFPSHLWCSIKYCVHLFDLNVYDVESIAGTIRCNMIIIRSQKDCYSCVRLYLSVHVVRLWCLFLHYVGIAYGKRKSTIWFLLIHDDDEVRSVTMLFGNKTVLHRRRRSLARIHTHIHTQTHAQHLAQQLTLPMKWKFQFKNHFTRANVFVHQTYILPTVTFCRFKSDALITGWQNRKHVQKNVKGVIENGAHS